VYVPSIERIYAGSRGIAGDRNSGGEGKIPAIVGEPM
jgi:hypothetical protein